MKNTCIHWLAVFSLLLFVASANAQTPSGIVSEGGLGEFVILGEAVPIAPLCTDKFAPIDPTNLKFAGVIPKIELRFDLVEAGILS